ncbi:MAG: hypothetical protein CR982_00730 [Candidatus Cloacimonadota bacterium]|nr:MAG: hypothetical protein CR982_00730 [Candidatus Cloacimonadota bacterium]PIE79761.1 MAG: hypothetical protein CSA15_02635 [Candidatus Delongbacteria bacterium]
MKKMDIYRSLIVGFIPILVFILSEDSLGLDYAIYLSILSGIAVFVYILLREKRKDFFILFDTFLVAVFGFVSIIFENDLFFKLKPGVIQLILLIMLSIMLFFDDKYLLKMISRYNNVENYSSQMISVMKKSMRPLFYILLVHTILIFISAFYMSKEIWGFIAGPLFYIIIGIYFLFNFIKMKRPVKKIT